MRAPRRPSKVHAGTPHPTHTTMRARHTHPHVHTMVTQVLEGAELLSERTDTEEKRLKGRPPSWRLACQTVVGDGENTGTVCLQVQPKPK